MPEFKPFSLADTMGSAISNAYNTLRLQDAMKTRDITETKERLRRESMVPNTTMQAQPTQALEGYDRLEAGFADPNQGYTPPPVEAPPAPGQPQTRFDKEAYFNRLQESGIDPTTEMAQSEQLQTAQLAKKLKAFEYISHAAGAINTPQQYAQFSADLINQGLMKPGDLPPPQEWGPKVKEQLKTLGLNAKDQYDLMYKGLDEQRKNIELGLKGRDTASKEKSAEAAMIKADAALKKAKQESGIKASDSNSIRASVAKLYGGTYDPNSGEIMGLSKSEGADATELEARASRIFADGKGSVTHAEAVQRAFKGKKPKSGGKTFNYVGPGKALEEVDEEDE